MPSTFNATGTPTYENVTNQYPAWGEQLQQQFGNQISGMLNAYGQLPNNWYQGSLTAGPTSMQMGAYQGAANPYQWGGALQQAAGALGAYSQPYNRAELNQYLDPYVGDVVTNLGRLSQEKLRADLEDVNSTFTGAGQFGSTRNRRFVEDALQRSQREYQGAVANEMDNAFDQANQTYLSWAGRPLQAATVYGQLGQLGSNLGWQDLNNQFAMGNTMRDIEQSSYDTAYKDWLTSLQLPQTLMGGLGQLWQQTGGQYWNNPNKQSSNQTMVPQSSGVYSLPYLLQLLGQLGGT